MTGIKSVLALILWFLIWVPTTAFVLIVLVRSFFVRPVREPIPSVPSNNGLLA